MNNLTRGAPEPKIDGRASATVIESDTRADEMTFACNIPVLNLNHFKMRVPKARAQFCVVFERKHILHSKYFHQFDIRTSASVV